MRSISDIAEFANPRDGLADACRRAANGTRPQSSERCATVIVRDEKGIERLLSWLAEKRSDKLMRLNVGTATSRSRKALESIDGGPDDALRAQSLAREVDEDYRLVVFSELDPVNT